MSLAKQPLAIAGVGMISCLGEGAEVNAAAMRCSYDGFVQTEFMQPYHAEPQLGAPIEQTGVQRRGIEKLAYFGQAAVNEATKSLAQYGEDQSNNLKLLMCLPDIQERAHYLNGDNTHSLLLEEIKKATTIKHYHPASQVYYKSRCGFTEALKQAQQTLYQDGLSYALILGIDSLLDSATLGYYGGNLYGEGRRLLGDNHSNGFIPGEAATAVLLRKPKKNDNRTVIISGVGLASETASFNNSQTDEPHVLRGKGLSDAIKNASQDAGVEIHHTAYRVASVSGEDYFFTEAALAQIKSLKRKVDDQPLWHPADSIGEVGAAVGGAITIMTAFALLKGYALGNSVLCHLSNDDEQRGAFIMQKEINNG